MGIFTRTVLSYHHHVIISGLGNHILRLSAWCNILIYSSKKSALDRISLMIRDQTFIFFSLFFSLSFVTKEQGNSYLKITDGLKALPHFCLAV